MEISVVLVEPEHEGNIGSVARLMKNFGLTRLWLVNPKAKLGEETVALASHARDVLDHARIFNNLDETLNGIDFAVGTTSIRAKRSSNILQYLLLLRNSHLRSQDLKGK
ncbi:MAG: TrmH family RNA methyltransferase [Candidatus Bathyarchaeota archaeon]